MKLSFTQNRVVEDTPQGYKIQHVKSSIGQTIGFLQKTNCKKVISNGIIC